MDNKNISPELQAALTELENGLKAATTAEAKAEIQKQIKAFQDQNKPADYTKDFSDLKSDIQVIKDAADKDRDALNEIQKSLQTRHLNKDRFDKDNFQDALLKGLEEKKAGLSSYKYNRNPVSIDLKVVGDIGGGNFTVSPAGARFATSTDLGNIPAPFPRTHMRNLIPTQAVTGDAVTIVRDNGGEGGPTSVAAGAVKPQSDRDFAKIVVPITKIAHWYRIPEEWLEDLPWLSGYISQIGIEELLKVEDAKIISNAAAGEFTGLVQNSTAYASPAALALNVVTPNNYDVLIAAWTQAMALNEYPNAHILNPGDYASMLLSKTTTGIYPLGANEQLPSVLGVPVYPINAMTPGKFFTMDSNLSTIGIRKGVNVRFYDQDQDNAIKNLVTIVIEERIVLVVYRTTSVIYGDFAAAKTALTKP